MVDGLGYTVKGVSNGLDLFPGLPYKSIPGRCSAGNFERVLHFGRCESSRFGDLGSLDSGPCTQHTETRGDHLTYCIGIERAAGRDTNFLGFDSTDW